MHPRIIFGFAVWLPASTSPPSFVEPYLCSSFITPSRRLRYTTSQLSHSWTLGEPQKSIGNSSSAIWVDICSSFNLQRNPSRTTVSYGSKRRTFRSLLSTVKLSEQASCTHEPSGLQRRAITAVALVKKRLASSHISSPCVSAFISHM